MGKDGVHDGLSGVIPDCGSGGKMKRRGGSSDEVRGRKLKTWRRIDREMRRTSHWRLVLFCKGLIFDEFVEN